LPTLWVTRSNRVGRAPTVGFDLLYAFVIVRLGRRELIWINVTANPTAEWVARQITEAGAWLCKKVRQPLARWPLPFDHALGDTRLRDLKPKLE
jgi:hypothetical protein